TQRPSRYTLFPYTTLFRSSFIDTICTLLPMDRIYDVNIGVFRMNKEYFKRISKNRLDTDIFSYPVEMDDGVVCYGDEGNMKEVVARELFKYLPGRKIYI